MEEGRQNTAATFGAGYARLQAVKRRYDPDNIFCTHSEHRPRLGWRCLSTVCVLHNRP